jgi:predicted secreted protein
MLNKYYRWFLLLWVSLFSVGFMGIAQAENMAPPVYTDSGKTIIVSQKMPQFTIRLAANPTTGYSWFLTDYSPQFIKVLTHAYHPAISQIAGASGHEEWTFAVNPNTFAAPQVIKISLLYARPWNLNDNNKSVIFTVITQ